MKYAFVRAQRAAYPVVRLCSVLRVSRSGYYAWCGREESERSRTDRRLLAKIRTVHAANHQAYGVLKTWRALRTAGVACGKHRVARLRRAAGIEARRRKRFRRAAQARQSAPPAPNRLAAPFAAARPNQIWVADITFIATRAGWVYLAVLLDVYSRLVAGWSMQTRPTQQLVSAAFRMATDRRRPAPGLIHHSDQGVQYAAGRYIHQLAQHGVVRSMSRKGNCTDNAVAESFFSSLKNELVHGQDYSTREEARTAIFEYIEVFYNRQRLHQSLGYQTPAAYDAMACVP